MQQGVTVWFTGLPCCGKTTIAKQVYSILKEQGFRVEHLDGDIVRQDLTSDLGFSKQDRDENLKRISFVAKLLTRNEVIVLATFVSPYRDRRAKIKETIGKDFLEIYVNCPVDECIRRDVKGMYKKALAGEIKDFTGVQDPYEPPEHPDLSIDSLDESVSESVESVLNLLKEKGYLDKN